MVNSVPGAPVGEGGDTAAPPSAALPGATSDLEVPPPRFSITVSRRTMIKSMMAASVAGGLILLTRGSRPAVPRAIELDANTPPIKSFSLAGTDGWVSMPVNANAMPPYFPDNLAPANGNSNANPRINRFTTYAFGFRNVTEYNPATSPTQTRFLVDNVKNHVQISAPLLYAQAGQDLRLSLFNLGMGNRPDLFDSHTIHFHGFANQIAYFDGVPDASLSVPPGQAMHYRYLPVDAGTYMYHCHVEDVEHVQMGMNGMVFIAPRRGVNYTYDVTPAAGQTIDRNTDPLTSTRFDRQFSLHLSEIFPQGHFGDSHIQDTDWTDFTGFFRLMNGRAYPDTIAPHAGTYATGEPGNPDAQITATGTALEDARRLRFQPLSALIQGESGEYILVRVSHLGYEQHSLVLEGLPVKIIGQDAKYLGDGRGGYYPDYQYTAAGGLQAARVPDPTRGDIATTTNRIDIGPGESRDLLVGPLPTVTAKTVFPLYDREFGYLNGVDSAAGYGGMRTEVHVYPVNGLGRPSAAELALLTGGQDAKTLDLAGNVVHNFNTTASTPTYADGSPILQAFPGKHY